jgi:hypothetical protein
MTSAQWDRRLAVDAPDLVVETRLVRVHAHELVGENLDTGLLVLGGPRRHVPDDLGLVARTALIRNPTGRSGLPESCAEPRCRAAPVNAAACVVRR